MKPMVTLSSLPHRVAVDTENCREGRILFVCFLELLGARVNAASHWEQG